MDRLADTTSVILLGSFLVGVLLFGVLTAGF
jgi:hypothetical protein